MANFYYVKDDGTAAAATDDGRFATTRQTGAFSALNSGAGAGASSYYPDIGTAYAAATPPADGDFILCSSSHDVTFTANETLTLSTDISIISVDDSNCDQYLAGARETCDNGGTTLIYKIVTSTQGEIIGFMGMTFRAEDTIQIEPQDGASMVFEDCKLEWVGAHNDENLILRGGQGYIKFVDTEINRSGNNTGNFGIQIYDRATVTWHNVSSTGVKCSGPLFHTGNDGGMLSIVGCDLNSMMATNAELFNLHTWNSGIVIANFDGCLLPTGWSVWQTDPTLSRGVQITLSSCGTANEYYQYLYWEGLHKAEVDLASYITATYDGSTGFSTKITTGAGAKAASPFAYKIAELPARDLTGATNYEVEFTSADSGLTDTEVFFRAVHNDNTNEALKAHVTTRNADPIAVGTTHTTSGTGTWAGGTGSLGTDYRETVPIGALANVDNGTVSIWAYVAIESTVINFDPAVTIT